jgi:hypothetical protein
VTGACDPGDDGSSDDSIDSQPHHRSNVPASLPPREPLMTGRSLSIFPNGQTTTVVNLELPKISEPPKLKGGDPRAFRGWWMAMRDYLAGFPAAANLDSQRSALSAQR